MRGARLHKALMNEAEINVLPAIKGRNQELLKSRNEKLIHRYYFYSRLQERKLAYETIIKILSQELDLSPARIMDIITDNSDRIAEISKAHLTIRQLARKFPLFNWNAAA